MTDTTAPLDRDQDPRRWFALVVIAIASLMVVLDASIVNIALPKAQAALHISFANRQWIVTAYTLTFGGLLLLGGRIADYAGRKRVFIIGLVGFALASALGGAAPDQGLLFAARGLQGAFGAILAPAALSLISVTFTDSKERARAFGVYGAISGVGAAIGLIMGGVLTQYLSWRWCLFVNIPMALIAVVLAIPNIRESRLSGKTKYDVPGALLSTIGFVAIVYGINEAATPGHGWSSPVTIWCLVVGVALLDREEGVGLERHPGHRSLEDGEPWWRRDLLRTQVRDDRCLVPPAQRVHAVTDAVDALVLGEHADALDRVGHPVPVRDPGRASHGTR